MTLVTILFSMGWSSASPAQSMTDLILSPPKRRIRSSSSAA